MKVVTFGEILLRLSSPGYHKLFQNNVFETSFCGAEANVAVSLANFGIDSCFVSKVPDNDVGQAAINALRYFGVDTTYVVRGGKRLGLYYLEKGASQRPSKVLYDRQYSAIAEAVNNDFNWDDIFDNATWFHITGINPALSESLKDISLDACKKAKEKGLQVSCDLNYRNKLWTSPKAEVVMSMLLPYVDVCIANEEDAEKVFGIKAESTDVTSGRINYEGYKKVALEIVSRFGCKLVALTLRTSISANDNKWSGMLYSADKKRYYFAKEYDIHIVDRVGSGDSFAAALIYGLISKMDYPECVSFAVAASCLKHTLEGDFNRVNIDEVFSLMKGDTSGRVKR